MQIDFFVAYTHTYCYRFPRRFDKIIEYDTSTSDKIYRLGIGLLECYDRIGYNVDLRFALCLFRNNYPYFILS